MKLYTDSRLSDYLFFYTDFENAFENNNGNTVSGRTDISEKKIHRFYALKINRCKC